MSEKRFKQSDPNIAIHSSIVIVWDSEKHCHMNQEKIIDLLNSLSEENEQLRQEIDEWKKENRELLDKIQEFERIPKSIRELWVE